VSQIPVAADRHFRRAHLKPARQRRRRWTFTSRIAGRVLLAIVAIVGAYRGAVTVAQAHVLQIQRIGVRGNVRLSNGDVLALLDGLRGQSLLRVDLDAWGSRLRSSTWVQSVDLRRSLPATIDVVITERVPLGIGRIGDRTYLVDEHGVLIDEYGPRYADLDLPIIDGLPSPAESGTTDPARMDLVSRLIRSLTARPEVLTRVSQVDVRDVHDAVVILSGDPTLVQLGEQQFLARLESYLELAPTLRTRVTGIDSADLRFDGRVYVQAVSTGPKTLARGAKQRQ
jgi:cell division protein FtsQ